eukprot:GHVQ01024765.1.p1 GENE.GHVQ01024765.1~~GHVQ01024765.1.p1  ORF type:complete len:266 (+),score=39.62 GHVQ01024765.1:76-873(+)
MVLRQCCFRIVGVGHRVLPLHALTTTRLSCLPVQLLVLKKDVKLQAYAGVAKRLLCSTQNPLPHTNNNHNKTPEDGKPEEVEKERETSIPESGGTEEYRMNVPGMGDSITEGTIVTWNKLVGEMVKADDVLCVIETDKVTLDIHAAVSGVLKSCSAKEGETVYVGGGLAVLDMKGSPSVPPSGVSQFRSTGSTPAPKHGNKHVPRIRFGRSHIRTSKDSQRFSEYFCLPERYRSKELEEEEIEAVNSGGATSKTVGMWRTALVYS